MTLAEHLTMAASANMFYFANDYENELNMKVAASNIKQRIFGVRVTIAQRKISGGLTRTALD